MITKEESTKIVNFMTFWPGVLVLGNSENAIFLLLFLSTLGHGSNKLSI